MENYSGYRVIELPTHNTELSACMHVWFDGKVYISIVGKDNKRIVFQTEAEAIKEFSDMIEEVYHIRK